MESAVAGTVEPVPLQASVALHHCSTAAGLQYQARAGGGQQPGSPGGVSDRLPRHASSDRPAGRPAVVTQ